MNLSELLAPLSVEAFENEHLGKLPVHIAGHGERWGSVFDPSRAEQLLCGREQDDRVRWVRGSELLATEELTRL